MPAWCAICDRVRAKTAWFDAEADGLLRVRRVEPDVDLIKVAAGADGRFVRCSMASGARGLVIEALGRGNVPPAMLDDLGGCRRSTACPWC